MQLLETLNIIKNDPYDITYIGIGSAVYRGTDFRDLQQYPPFMEELYNNTQYKIRLINIDMKFEEPLFLENYLPNLKKISELEYILDDNNKKLSVIYLTIQLDLYKINDNNSLIGDLEWLDNINKVIMEQNNILIVGNYAGYSNNMFELYFEKLYYNTKYAELFNKLITYDFTVDGHGSCYCNLLENYPIIDKLNKELIKIDRSLDTLHEYFINNVENGLIINKLKLIFENSIFSFIDRNHYIYRNLMRDNIFQSMGEYIENTVFNKINLKHSFNYDKDEIVFIFINKLNNIKQYITYNYPIKKNNYDLLTDLIENIIKYDYYEWSKNFKSLINIIISDI